MSYTVTLYHNASGKKFMNKALTSYGDVSCEFKNPMDVQNPTVYIAADAAYDDVNYLYIPQFGRYYYAKPVGGRGANITYECTSDVLMSFKAGILASPAVISRNPWHFDLYLPDPKLPVEARTVSSVLTFPGDHFRGTNNSYVITCIGSGITGGDE